ncbi:MAG: CBS domain-containing protein [Austwickia sp.]|jgi:CBS domain-containing protein|nr:CBS domain-containing protein [Austwickia sp.]MBK8436006.1 CBS domain-containing protein [Austwickia sp.]MBK9101685.1 CBS domain-containing protein [Austwickia sp.]
MRIKDVMRGKSSQAIVTVKPGDTVAHLLNVLAQYNIGAVVVTEDGKKIDGIISERDVVRHMGANRELIDAAISTIMTSDVHTCTAETEVVVLAEEMTQQRFRHVPVVEGDVLVGLVSIGDIVKHRISMLQSERDHLESYIKQ